MKRGYINTLSINFVRIDERKLFDRCIVNVLPYGLFMAFGNLKIPSRVFICIVMNAMRGR